MAADDPELLEYFRAVNAMQKNQSPTFATLKGFAKARKVMVESRVDRDLKVKVANDYKGGSGGNTSRCVSFHVVGVGRSKTNKIKLFVINISCSSHGQHSRAVSSLLTCCYRAVAPIINRGTTPPFFAGPGGATSCISTRGSSSTTTCCFLTPVASTPCREGQLDAELRRRNDILRPIHAHVNEE